MPVAVPKYHRIRASAAGLRGRPLCFTLWRRCSRCCARGVYTLQDWVVQYYVESLVERLASVSGGVPAPH